MSAADPGTLAADYGSAAGALMLLALPDFPDAASCAVHMARRAAHYWRLAGEPSCDAGGYPAAGPRRLP